MVHPSHSGRRKENFVQWKEPTQLHGSKSTSNAGTSSSGVPSRKRTVNTPSTHVSGTMQRRVASAVEYVPRIGSEGGAGSPRPGLQSEVGGQTKFVPRQGPASLKSTPIPRTKPVHRSVGSRQGSLSREGPSSGRSIPSKNQLAGRTERGDIDALENDLDNTNSEGVQFGRHVRNREARNESPLTTPRRILLDSTAKDAQKFPQSSRRVAQKDSNHVHRRESSGSRGSPVRRQQNVPLTNESPSSCVFREQSHDFLRNPTELAVDEVSEEEDHDVDCVDREEDEMVWEENARAEDTRTYAFYNEDNVDRSDDSAEDEAQAGPMVEQDNVLENCCVDEQDGFLPTESEKRRDRRHDLVARRREGDRRRAEGLPRNYLLVDEYRNEPYGQGVGSWRKEVMLLSRKLDPAIGNINRQPDDAVKEIGEWIQHTWEYSRPIKWEYVKEVIARGVSLRRSDLWKRIRVSESKPDDVSDRTWRSLTRELESPAMLNKFQNCSKANACRQNFGRTGPSGEVGVRERLRKSLKRSPSPTEIREEMARPKGYAGITRRKQVDDNIMHGGGARGGAQAVCGSHRRSTVRRSEGNDELMSNESTEVGIDADANLNRQLVAPPDEDEVEVENGANASRRDFPPSEEQVMRHPAVIRMMERLEALERRGHEVPVDVTVVQEQGFSIPTARQETKDLETDEGVQGIRVAHEVAVVQPIRKSGRSRTKVTQ